MRERVKNQEREFEALLATHGGMLTRIAASYEANPALQQELMQDIALAIWRALPRFRGQSSIKTFVARIAQNRCISHVARQSREPRTAGDDADPASTAPNPEESAAATRRRTALLAAVRSLPVAQRHVVTLALEGFSHQEIADTLGITVNNASVRWNRAKAALQKKLRRVG